MFMCMNSNTKNKIYNFIDSFFPRIVFPSYGKAKYKAFIS